MTHDSKSESSLREQMLIEALTPFALMAKHIDRRHDPIFKSGDDQIRSFDFHKAQDVLQSLSPDTVPPSEGGNLPIYGDWRDFKNAIITFDPDFNAKPDDIKELIWKYVKGAIEHFNPLYAKCGPFGCGNIVPVRDSYKCSDCHGRYCEHCVKPHFGPAHIPHR